jgi:chemotaxis protein CheD
VGITFLVPRLGVGALCHPMLPLFPAKESSTLSVMASRRYVDFAIHDMIRQLDSLGALRMETQVKLFGGGDVLPMIDGERHATVGKQNCDVAQRVLDEEGFVIIACRLRGDTGVRIEFNTGSGEVLLRKLTSSMARAGAKPVRKVYRSRKNA